MKLTSLYNSIEEFADKDPVAYKDACKRNMINELCLLFNWKWNNNINPFNYWTKEKCKIDAIKYNSKSKWKDQSGSAYNSARKNGWLEECCKHMPELKKPNWSFESCLKNALKYNYKAEWRNKSNSAYNVAYKNGWLDECCKHMNGMLKPKGYWTLDLCLQDALKYKSKTEWCKNNSTAYNSARKGGWLEECCKHMVELRKPNNYWTLDSCLQDALKYNSKLEWRQNSAGYGMALENGWLEECCKHMVESRKPSNYWTLDSCLKDALKYNSKSKWCKNNSSAYSLAHKNGWLEECCKHMNKLRNRYSIEDCKNEAIKYSSRSIWKLNSPKNYRKAMMSNWLKVCCKHMES
jgi:hypothetical protein